MRKSALILACGLVLNFVALPLHAGEIAIDIVKGTLNGKNLDDLTVDSITDTLGRPTDSYKSGGTTFLRYYELGLYFGVSDRGTSLSVFLHRHQLAEGNPFFEKFTGKLNKGLSGNWKYKRFVEEFAEFKLVKEGACPFGECAVCLKSPDTWLQVCYDEGSGFLNWIILTTTKSGRGPGICDSR